MKKTNLKLTVAIGLFIASAFTIFSISGCQKDDLYEINPWNQEEYLDISINATASNMDKWSAADHEAFGQLRKRITMGLDENGLIYLKEQSAQEVNVSPRLYAIIREIVDNSNRFRLKKAIEKNHIPLTKSGSDEEPQPTPPTDCVAQAIYEALVHFGITSISAASINESIEAQYGQGVGVPADKFLRTVRTYLKGHAVSVGYVPNNYNYSQSDNRVYLLSGNLQTTGGHAGFVLSADSSAFFVKDNQHLDTTGTIMVFRYEVLEVFQATGTK